MGIESLGLGERINDKDSRNLSREIGEILDLRSFQDFPGAQPVTMCRQDIEDLKKREYYVCEKSDGVRALLLCKTVKNKGYAFAMDRKCTFIKLPSRFMPAELMLFDGEIIQHSKDTFTFMIFDMIIYNGKSIANQNLLLRLNAANRYLYDSHNWHKMTNIPEDKRFTMQLKRMHKSYGLAEVYRKIIPQLTHENDGLIFTCVNHAYVPGACRAYLKWKPAHLNSVDFRMKRSKEIVGLYDLYTSYGNNKEVLFATYWIDEIVKDIDLNVQARDGKPQEVYYKEPIDYNQLDGLVGEFSYKPDEYTVNTETFDLEPGRWSLLRIREDKNFPNGYKTVVGVVFSINESLEYPELERSIPEIRAQWKAREEVKRKAVEPSAPVNGQEVDSTPAKRPAH
ncbi:mRNA guanylyltransferase [Nematocida homosporus]|uniref:mRNA guanylyltransferase n=1 Tax=Nematocida homosporus TaxID=1912981 RepID=UPI002220B826|nr:mRNA guanylyltransferase [Nematocida homosporus]KAI5186860.1 mRNA guanylyltransferase [Nematocida homosporus]